MTYKLLNVVDMNLLSSEIPLGLWYQLIHDQNLDPNETGIVDLSEVANKPTYVILTSSRLILAENLNFLFTYSMLNILNLTS